MVEIINPTTVEEFENLKRGDLIIVEWNDFWVKHTEEAKKIMVYNIHCVKPKSNEIICRLKGNHYFNYHLYLGLDENKSNALDVKIIKFNEEVK